MWEREKNTKKFHLTEVKDCAYIIPFLSNLEVLLMNEEVQSHILNEMPSSDGVLRSVLDGEYYRNTDVFSNNQNALAIIFYYDELGVANPIGPNAAQQKLGVCYWTLGNINPRFRSSEQSIMLYAIAKYTVIAKHGLSKLMDNLISDVSRLRSEGISVHIKGEPKVFRGSVLFTVGDNPASAKLTGFKESMSAHRPCRTCTISQDDWKKSYMTNNFQLRDFETHKQHVLDVTEVNVLLKTIKFWKRFHGVNGPSDLAIIPGFDPTKCFPQDSMHVYIEGVVEVAIRSLLRYYIHTEHLFTIDELNFRIEHFNFGYFSTNKPKILASSELERQNHLKQSASQILGLAITLPFILDERLSDKPDVLERMKCHILLLKILNLSLAYEIHNTSVQILTRMNEVFFVQFNFLYPEDAVFKFHLMLHIPLYIKLFGPARQQWSFRFESQYQVLKSLVPVIRNFKNMPASLAYRFQSKLCSKLMILPDSFSKKFLYQGDEIKFGQNVLLTNLPYSTLLDNYIDVFDRPTLQLIRSPKVVRYGTEYAQHSVILLELNDDNLPIFGGIDEIFIVKNQINLLYTVLKSSYFNEHLNAYCLETSQITNKSAIEINDLIFPHAIPTYECNNKKFAVLLFHEHVEFY